MTLADAILRWKAEVLGNPMARNLLEGDIVHHLDSMDASVVIDGYAYFTHAARLKSRRVVGSDARLEAAP